MCSGAGWGFVRASDEAGMWLAIGADDPWAVILPLQVGGKPAQRVVANLRRWFPPGTLAIVGLVYAPDAQAHAEALLSGFDVYVVTAAGPRTLRIELERLFTAVRSKRDLRLSGDV